MISHRPKFQETNGNGNCNQFRALDTNNANGTQTQTRQPTDLQLTKVENVANNSNKTRKNNNSGFYNKVICFVLFKLLMKNSVLVGVQ